jgi:Na+/proline symporter
MRRMAALDWLIVVAFFVYAVYVGLRARREASRGLESYFLAGRSLSGWKAGASMAATQFAADTPLLVTGLVATAGIFSLWRLWSYAIAFLLLGFVLAPCWRRARVLTDAELTELRYGGRPAALLRAVKALYFGTLFNCTVLAMVLWAAAAIAEPFLLWNEWLPAGLFDAAETFVTWVGVPFARAGAGDADVWIRSTNNLLSLGAIVSVTALYSATGGLRGVVETDVAQIALMLVGTALYAAWVMYEVGGPGAIPERIRALYANGGPGGIRAEEILAFTPSRAREAGGALLAVFALQWLVQMNADGTGYLAQRSMACRSDRDARQAALVFTALQILVRSLLWLPIALGLLVLFPPDLSLQGAALAADREASFVRGIAELLPIGVRGVLLAAMLAALASTIDTHLNWGSSYWTNDLYRRFYCEAWRGRVPSDASLVWVARVASFFILLLALFIMTRLASIQTAWHASLLLGAGMGVLLVLRWLWWRITAWGELAAIAASLALVPLLLYRIPAEGEALRLLWVAAGSTAAGVLASLVGGPEQPERLRAFYLRVHPPGFWAPVAAAAGEIASAPARRLARGLLATALAACSTFALLTGLGAWIAASPPPVWVPQRGIWIAGLLVSGVALVPFWWRLAMRPIREPSR